MPVLGRASLSILQHCSFYLIYAYLNIFTFFFQSKLHQFLYLYFIKAQRICSTLILLLVKTSDDV